MAKQPEKRTFVLKIGGYERHELTLTPRDAARAATQIARGVVEGDDWRPGRAVKLYDGESIVMSCRPTIRPTIKAEKAGRSPSRTMAACDITPSFKKQLRKRRRARR